MAPLELVRKARHTHHGVCGRKGLRSSTVCHTIVKFLIFHSRTSSEIATACEERGHETASHCYRWINYTNMDAESEEKFIRQAIDSFRKTSPSGKVPVGWYYGRPSPRTRALVCKVYRELGLELLYQSDTCLSILFCQLKMVVLTLLLSQMPTIYLTGFRTL